MRPRFQGHFFFVLGLLKLCQPRPCYPLHPGFSRHCSKGSLQRHLPQVPCTLFCPSLWFAGSFELCCCPHSAVLSISARDRQGLQEFSVLLGLKRVEAKLCK